MATHDYHFVTCWRVRGTIEEASEVLADPLDLPRWWPSVYLATRAIERGDPSTDVGRVIELFTKGFLPYTLTWRLRVTENRRPHGSALEAFGDLEGKGVWTLERDGDFAALTYDWRVRAEKPLLRRLSFVLKPIFEANHRWAMDLGEKSLALEMARRRATSDAERAAIPAPPGPTFARMIRGR